MGFLGDREWVCRQALVGSAGGGDEEDGTGSVECLAKQQSQTPAFSCRW